MPRRPAGRFGEDDDDDRGHVAAGSRSSTASSRQSLSHRNASKGGEQPARTSKQQQQRVGQFRYQQPPQRLTSPYPSLVYPESCCSSQQKDDYELFQYHPDSVGNPQEDDSTACSLYLDEDTTTTNSTDIRSPRSRERTSTFDRLVDQRDWHGILLASSSAPKNSTSSAELAWNDDKRVANRPQPQNEDDSVAPPAPKAPSPPPLPHREEDVEVEEQAAVKPKKKKKPTKNQSLEGKSTSSAMKKKKKKKRAAHKSEGVTRKDSLKSFQEKKTKSKKKKRKKKKPSAAETVDDDDTIKKDPSGNIQTTDSFHTEDPHVKTILSLSLEDEFSLAPAENMRTKADITHEKILNHREPKKYTKAPPKKTKQPKTPSETAPKELQPPQDPPSVSLKSPPSPAPPIDQSEQPKKQSKPKGLFKNLWKTVNGNRGHTKKDPPKPNGTATAPPTPLPAERLASF